MFSSMITIVRVTSRNHILVHTTDFCETMDLG